MRKLKIVICTSGPKSPLSKQNWALARALATAGHEVTLLIDHEMHDLVGLWEGCTVLTWPSRRPVHWRDAFFLWRLFKRSRPDAILANFGSVNLAVLIGFLCRVPIRVAWYRTLSDQIALDTPNQVRWKTAFLAKRKAIVYRLATHIAPVSEAAQADVCKTFAVPLEKCRIFHTCREDPREALGDQLVEKADRMRIVCVGRLNRSKGQDILLHAMKELQKIEPGWSWTLELVGDGPERHAYRKLAVELGLENSIVFGGFVEHQEVLRRVARAHVMVVPFRTDAGPGVIAEGLGLGMPMVVSASGAMPHQIGDSPCALLVPPEDPKALAEGLRTVLASPELRERMSYAARTLFLTKFHLDFWVADVMRWLIDTTVRQTTRQARYRRS